MALLIVAIKASANFAVEAWVQRFTTIGDSRNISVDVDRDSSGAIIVAGYTEQFLTGTDILILKYDSAGVSLWTNQFNGPANGHDAPTSLVIGKDDQIYITGYTENETDRMDLLTLAYSPAGVLLWTNRYDTKFQPASASYIVVNEQGETFIAGTSYTTDGGLDVAIIAYSAGGTPLWTNVYDSPGREDNHAAAITLDSDENVVVAAVCHGENHSFAATISYSAQGTPLWTNYAQGPVNYVRPAGLVSSDSGSIVLAASWRSTDTMIDLAAIAYSNSGTPLWTNVYDTGLSNDNYASAIEIDQANATVFVVGPSEARVSTVAYSVAGVSLWTNEFYVERFPTASELALDSTQTLIVRASGRSVFDQVIVAYSSTGSPLWTNFSQFFAPDFTIGANDNIVLSGYNAVDYDRDLLTVTCSNSGFPLRTNHYNGPLNLDDVPSGAALGPDGMIIVTGPSRNPDGQSKYATVAFTPSGLPLWTNYYNGSFPRAVSLPCAVAVRSDGTVIVTGRSLAPGLAFEDYLTIAYAPSGIPLWTNRYDGGFFEIPSSMAIDSEGIVFVTGTARNAAADSADFLTVAYSPEGTLLWTNRYTGPARLHDQADAIAVSSDGRVFVTGHTTTNNGTTDIATVAYSRTGTPLWTNLYNHPRQFVSTPSDVAVAIAVDNAAGQVIVTGKTDFHLLTIAYSSDGFLLWTNVYAGSGSVDEPAAMALDAHGNIYVTGSSQVGGGSLDYVTLAYSRTGNLLWTNNFAGYSLSPDRATSVAVDQLGNILVTGHSWVPGPSSDDTDFVTICYRNNGIPMWTNRYAGSALGPDEPRTVLAAHDGVVVVGKSDSNYRGTNHDFVVVKYITPYRLSVSLAAPGQVTLAWPSDAVDYRLQQSSQINGPWTDVTDPADTVGADKVTRLPTNPAKTFFRLSRLSHPAELPTEITPPQPQARSLPSPSSAVPAKRK